MSNRGIAILTVFAVLTAAVAGVFWYNNSAMNHNSAQTSVTGNSTAGSSYNNDNMPTNSSTPETVNSAGVTKSLNLHEYAKNLISSKPGQPIKKFTLTAQESELQIAADISMPVWTYNGTVPGPEIRVAQGDFVQVELRNELEVPVTIHWHGYPLLSPMDGIPGVTQDAVKPGETFTYEFSADVAGTYWYHSHQEGSTQVDKGLYGALVVEPRNKEHIDKDFTLILDEWMSDPSAMSSMDNSDQSASGSSGATESGMAGMDMSGMDMSGNSQMTEEEMMAYYYDIYTVNGKSGDMIAPLEVNKGEVVKMRFVNAGYRSHGIHIPGQDIKVVGTDGQDIYDPGIIKDQIINIAPGERYDVEFTVSSEDNFVIDAHDDNAYNDQLKIPVNVMDGSGNVYSEDDTVEYLAFDLFSYGDNHLLGEFSLTQKYNIDYTAQLNTRTNGNALQYTINGSVFSELPPLEVKAGELVKLTYMNKSAVDHPMHLHGHFFQVLSIDGTPVSGSPIVKDTIMVKAGEEIVVAFRADNPGIWVQHCHELHHAAAGMMQEVVYTDYHPNYIPDPNNKDNKPE